MRLVVALMLLALFGAAPAHAAVEYTVTDLSAPGQPTRDAWALNDDGVIVGTMNTGAPTSAFRWTEGPGLRGMEGRNGIPLDVNPSGVSVGLFDRPQDGFFTTAARWDVFGSVRAMLPGADPQCPGGDNEPEDCDGSYAHGIGADGVAVGAATINGGAGSEHAPAYWLPTATDAIRLQTTPGVLEARNAAGMMVGQDGRNAAVWRAPGDKVVLQQMETGDRALARDVNDAGVVVGDGATLPGLSRNRAFTWTQAEGMRRLKTLGFGTEAHAISARGEIVGMSRVTDDEAGKRAVRWAGVDGTIVDLNTLIPPDSGWTLTEAHDVNANGWIVGRGIKDGQDRAFLLRPAPALSVKLEGAGVNPFDDTFAVKATITNVGTAPVTGLHLIADLAPAFPYPLGSRAIVVRIAGPGGAIPETLAPGQQVQLGWIEQADAPGYVLYTARFGGIVRGLPQTAASGGKPFGKLSKVKPSKRELQLARALGWDDDVFAAAPDNLKQTTDFVREMLVQNQRAKYDVLAKELGGARATLEATGTFIGHWTSRDGIGELTATASALYQMGRNGQITTGLVGEAATYWTTAATSEAARAETQRQLTGMTNDAIAATQVAYDRTLAAGKKTLTTFEDDLSRDPVRAMGQLIYGMSKIESELALEYAKGLLGDKALKATGVLRNVGKARNGVDDTVEAIDDQRRVAQAIGDPPPAPFSAVKGDSFIGMTPHMRDRIAGHVAAIQKRFPTVDLRVSVRPLSPGDVQKFKDGFIPKIEAIPIKKINEIDVKFLGAQGGLDEVGYFTPKLPPKKVLNAMSPELRADVKNRYQRRLMESQAMAGKKIKDPVLQKKVADMRKALGDDGHTFEETISGRVIRKTELKLSVDKSGNVNLLKNEALKINGRTVGKPGAGFTGDLDLKSSLDGANDIPAGFRGAVELNLQHALANDPELPFGFHGWGGFDLTASEINRMLVISERLSTRPLAEARAEATRYARELGCRPEDLLQTRRNGFVVTFTREGVFVEP